VSTVVNGLEAYYETDLIMPLIEEVQSLSGRTYGADERDDVAIRIVAEHGRATTFLIADGVQPSNEGRGYILRRMLRRAVSQARGPLGIDAPFMERLVRTTVERMGNVYPELRENEAFVLQVATSEEERFSATLRQGMQIFHASADRTERGGTIAGEDAFKLFDTFGFPPQLTEELASEAGLSVDMDRFAELMDEQRVRARASAKKVEIGVDAGTVPPSEFVGYSQPEAEAVVQLLLDPEGRELAAADEGQPVRIFLARTPFYAESGGQVGDQGEIRTQTGSVRVHDAQRAGPEAIMHLGIVTSGEIRPRQDAIAEIDRGRREATARAHTSTHIVHATLREILGDHARQAGSLVAPGRLRFDFPHPSAVPLGQLEEAELLANRRLARDDDVRIFETSMREAKELGATMLFGEKYGDVVRVAEIGDYSRELCGGTHVSRTGTIALIRILHEGSIGSGMRRVEALVGPDAVRQINGERELLLGIVEALGSKDPEAALERARRVIEENKRLRSELGSLKRFDRDSIVDQLAGSATPVDGFDLVVSELPGEDAGRLRELAQKVRDKLAARPAAVVLGAGGERAQLVAALTAPGIERGVTAPALLAVAAAVIGGGAGGKDILANAGGKDGERVADALGGIPARLAELLAGS
jgi:alanyl-tRNA synthetase